MFKVGWWIFAGVSVALHFGTFGSISFLSPERSKKKDEPVKIKVVEQKKGEVSKPKPKPKPKPSPKPRKIAQKRKPTKKPKKNAAKLQGLTKDSFVKDSRSNFQAPAGNTLMRKDEGKRLTPEEIDALEQDLSSDAILIQGSFTIPEYTQLAIDANLEGRYIVDVFVDEKGNVTEAELRRKVGYGMDVKIIELAQVAKFVPKKNARGVPESSWAEIKINLILP